LSAAKKQHKTHQEFALNFCGKYVATSSKIAACDVEHRFISENGESRHETTAQLCLAGFNNLQ